MTTPAAKWKAAERARHKEAGRVAVTHYIYPADRAKVARYIKRLNERSLTTYTETPPQVLRKWRRTAAGCGSGCRACSQNDRADD
jgi:hypothetical protein